MVRQALRQALIFCLRSSPLRPVASSLQRFILFCCEPVFLAVSVAGALALKHSFMKALRSPPFLPSASLFHVAILLGLADLSSLAWAGLRT